MIDSGRRSNLFRRYGVSAPHRCAPASRSSRFLVSTKNLFRGQGVETLKIHVLSKNLFDAVTCPCFGRVTMNNPS